MEITVFELRTKVYLYKDIPAELCSLKIGKLIDTALASDEEGENFHNTNRYKDYVYGGLCPNERDKVYKSDTVYQFQLRTVNKELAENFIKKLQHFYNEDMNVLMTDVTIVQKKYIDKLYSLTPIIIKDYGENQEKKGYWKNHYSIDFFQRRIVENLIKKYNAFTAEKLEENFQLFTCIELSNGKPVTFPYKGITLLGDKGDFRVDSNDSAQELAYFALGVGIGEVNARGAGFVNFKSL